jgi:hypothetical protein
VMRTPSGSAGQSGLKPAGPAALSSLFLFDVSLPPAIRHSGHKPASHVDEAPQVAAPGGYSPGAIASSYPETRIL